MDKIKLHFDGIYRRYTDKDRELTSSYTYRSRLLIPQDKINDLDYIGNAILSEMYNRPDNKDFKDKIIFVDGMITFDMSVNEWPDLQGNWIIITNIEKDGDTLIGNTELRKG